MRAPSSSAVPRPATRRRLPRLEPQIPETSAYRLPSWLGSASGVPSQAFDLDGFHLGVQGPRDAEPAWEVYPASGVRIGRSSNCGVVLKDGAISRYHAEIERVSSGRYAIRDLISVNGIRVNGKPTKVWTLNDGDVIQIGPYLLIFGGGVLPKLPADVSAEEVEPRDGVYGRTFAMGHEAERQQSERSVNQRAYLQVLGDRHRISGLRVCQYVIECDAIVIGGCENADLQLTSKLAPRICCVVVRSEGRFSLHPIAPWPFGPKLNGYRIGEAQLLDDLDEVMVGGAHFRFRIGGP